MQSTADARDNWDHVLKVVRRARDAARKDKHIWNSKRWHRILITLKSDGKDIRFTSDQLLRWLRNAEKNEKSEHEIYALDTALYALEHLESTALREKNKRFELPPPLAMTKLELAQAILSDAKADHKRVHDLLDLWQRAQSVYRHRYNRTDALSVHGESAKATEIGQLIADALAAFVNGAKGWDYHKSEALDDLSQSPDDEVRAVMAQVRGKYRILESHKTETIPGLFSAINQELENKPHSIDTTPAEHGQAVAEAVEQAIEKYSPDWYLMDANPHRDIHGKKRTALGALFWL